MSTATIRAALVAATACFALVLGACSNQSSHHDQGGNSSASRGSNPKQDLSALQGRWEQLPDQPGGSGTPRQRVVKEVSGDTETVTTYGPNGQVVQAQTAKVRLSRSGPVDVYMVRDLHVTAGSGGNWKGKRTRRLARVAASPV